MTTPSHRPVSLATAEDVKDVFRHMLELSEIVHARIDELAARIEALEARK